MNGIDFPVARVLDGIDAALEAGLAPVKVNMVVRRGVNESSIVPMARWARETGVTCASSSTWTSGHSNGWRLDEVVPAAEADRRRSAPLAGRAGRPGYRGEVAGRWRYLDGVGRVRRHLVGHRSRSAATARGRGCRPTASSTRACSPSTGRDVRAVLRDGVDDEASRRSWPTSGARATTATRSCARERDRPRRCPRSRCSRWAADRRSGVGLSTACPQPVASRGHAPAPWREIRG